VRWLPVLLSSYEYMMEPQQSRTTFISSSNEEAPTFLSCITPNQCLLLNANLGKQSAFSKRQLIRCEIVNNGFSILPRLFQRWCPASRPIWALRLVRWFWCHFWRKKAFTTWWPWPMWLIRHQWRHQLYIASPAVAYQHECYRVTNMLTYGSTVLTLEEKVKALKE
jgi:hypothetical protein